MAKKTNKPRQREIGKTKKETKPLIDPRYKNLFWTIVFFVILLIFFIVNNTGNSPDKGSYPPGYDSLKQQKELGKEIPDQVNIKN